MQLVKALAVRDLQLALRKPSDMFLVIIFFLLALALFPLGVGASPDILARIGAGVIWVLALLAVLLPIERLYQADHSDGSLELMLFSDVPLEVIVLVKCAIHWLTGGLLLVLVSPVLAIFMNLPAQALWALPLALLLGTPTLTLVGSIGAALIIGSRRGSMLTALLVLPLYIPILIFGVSAVDGVLLGLGSRAQFLILGALLLFGLAVAPFASAAAIRNAIE